MLTQIDLCAAAYHEASKLFGDVATECRNRIKAAEGTIADPHEDRMNRARIAASYDEIKNKLSAAYLSARCALIDAQRAGETNGETAIVRGRGVAALGLCERDRSRLPEDITTVGDVIDHLEAIRSVRIFGKRLSDTCQSALYKIGMGKV